MINEPGDGILVAVFLVFDGLDSQARHGLAVIDARRSSQVTRLFTVGDTEP